MRSVIRALAAVLVIILCAEVVSADYLVVSRHAKVKAAPQGDGQLLEWVDRGQVLTLVENSQTNGYYHVRLPGSHLREGWVYRTLVRRYPGTPEPGAVGPPWGLHIVILDVGQADAIVLVASNGEACVIDSGKRAAAGRRMAGFLSNRADNGVGQLTRVKMGFATHYDLDHIGGFEALQAGSITLGSIYDQGPSKKRHGAKFYTKYLNVVGDPNDNMIADPGEPSFIRRRAEVGLRWSLGDARIRCVSVRGDTAGADHDLDLDPSGKSIDENPGSIALLVTLGDFEFYTAGDQTSGAWKSEPDAEMGVVRSGVLGDDTDIDVLKVSHHGSDTSTGRDFVRTLDPEVAIISSTYTRDELPKMVAVQQLVENNALVLVTGDGREPKSGTFAYSKPAAVDDGYRPPGNTVFNEVGDVHIYVSADGSRYTVTAAGFSREFTTADGDHAHP